MKIQFFKVGKLTSKKYLLIKIIPIFIILFAILWIKKSNKQDFSKNEEAKTVFSESEENEELSPANEVLETLDDKNILPTFGNIGMFKDMELISKYVYNIEEDAYVTENDLRIEEYARRNLRTNLRTENPKILIFHTHSQECFIDSEKGVESESIVAIGNKLAEILVNDYNIAVIHDKGQYDIVDGKEQREGSYQTMEPAVKKLLEKYPDVEIAIDLHRDGVPDDVKLLTEIDGRPTAKIMFFNGIARKNNNGVPEELEDLENPYLEDNLALSLQMQLTANEIYPGFTRKLYIKPYRYSLHMLPKSLLVEVGANTNTYEEAENAMYPLAKILVSVLSEE